MATEPQIYTIGTCALGIHASFFKTVSIYHFLLVSVAEKILRTTPVLLVPQVSSCPMYVVEFIPKGGNNEQFKLFMQNKPKQTRSEFTPKGTELPTGELLGILKPATKQTNRTKCKIATCPTPPMFHVKHFYKRNYFLLAKLQSLY